MNGNVKLNGIICCSLLIFTLLPLPAQQNETWIDHAEETINREDDSGYPEELCVEQQELLSHPINLNRATREQLELSGLFTPFQVRSIVGYREKYGDLISVYELASIPGFRRHPLEEQAIYLTVNETAQIESSKSSPGMAVLYAGNTFSTAENQSNYPGSLWKTSLKIKKSIGRKGSLGLIYEKDTGEKALWGYRPEHLCGYLEWNGNRIVEQIIAGSFRINNGMGLSQGSGLMYTPEGIQSRPLKLSTLKPYAGSGESIIHQGAACRLNLGIMKVILWTSFQNIDLSLGNLTSTGKKTDWSDHIRATGYHRTPAEQSGRNLAYLGNAGIQVVTTLGRLNLGAQYSPEINGLTGRGRDSLQNFNGPTIYHGTSLHWHYRLNNLEFYGEYVPGNKNSSALLMGSRFFINDFLSGTLQIHFYGASQRGVFCSAYGSGSHIENEKGLLLVIHAEPYRGVRADMNLEYFEYPAPRALTRVPSSGFRLNLTLQNGSQEKFQWRIRIVHTTRQHTPSSTDHPGIPPISNIQNNRIDGRVVYGPLPWFSWQTRLVISYTPEYMSSYGFASVQQVTVRFNKWIKCTTQLVMFQIPSWDNRIYLYEPGLFQQFRFPVYSGSGNKFSLVNAVNLGKRITLEMRGSVIGGMEFKRWEVDLQLRLKL